MYDGDGPGGRATAADAQMKDGYQNSPCEHAAGVSTLDLLSIPLAETSCREVAGMVSEHLATACRGSLTLDATNTMGLASSCVDSELMRAMTSYDLLLPDGMPVVWCVNAKGARLADRVYGPYVTEAVLETLPEGTRVAVVGGSPIMHERLAAVGPERFPRARFVSFDASEFSRFDDGTVERSLARAQDAGAELIFICLGVPKQYLWVARAREAGPRAVLFSVGGAFDFVLGMKKLAPAWMQQSGLTWLHRMIREPRRLFTRYAKFNSLFTWFVLRREIATGTLSATQMLAAEKQRRNHRRDP